MKKLLFVGLCLLLMANYAAAADNSNVAHDPMGVINTATASSIVVNFPFDGFPQQFRVTTTGAYLDIRIVDCCIAGDQWVVRAINMNNGVQDVRGICSGWSAGYSTPDPASALWSYAGTGRVWIAKIGDSNIDAIVEVRASKSNAVSPSSAFLRVLSNADVVVTALTENSTGLTLPIAPLPMPTQ
jgi:hypothetical protein